MWIMMQSTDDYNQFMRINVSLQGSLNNIILSYKDGNESEAERPEVFNVNPSVIASEWGKVRKNIRDYIMDRIDKHFHF